MARDSSEFVVYRPAQQVPTRVGVRSMGEFERATPIQQAKIWIDLDNSPHVPFFVPIIEELQKRDYQILLTARDSYQVCELLELHRLACKVIGGHWGKNRAAKMLGTCLRAAELVPFILREKPDLAVSHGSRAQSLSCRVLQVPSILIFDYEYTSRGAYLYPDWVFIPELIPESAGVVAKNKVFRYPGLKEDVYVSRLKPDPQVKNRLGLSGSDLVVTVRPPATEAHYHNAGSEVLFTASLNFLLHHRDVRVILLPRNHRQLLDLRKEWKEGIAKGKIIIPEQVVDGLNLIWFSDLVISGGGTMNREAAALGVPVYSIFRGKLGAVDKYLVTKKRLVLLESLEDVRTKVVVERKATVSRRSLSQSDALQFIVNGISSIAELECLPARSCSQFDPRS